MINTNGFITKYIESCKYIAEVEKEIEHIKGHLEKPYEEIEKIKVMYNVSFLEAKKKELAIRQKDVNNYKEYYWYRSIVDGLYNLLEKYGYKYVNKVWAFIIDKYHIAGEMDEGFRMFYLDSIQSLSPATTLSKNIRSEDIFDIYYENYDGDWLGIPSNVDIEECLTKVEEYLIALAEENEKKTEDEEYATYLRLKEKYEVRNNE
jgi:hypothetical protein